MRTVCAFLVVVLKLHATVAQNALNCTKITNVCCHEGSNCTYIGGSGGEHQYQVEGKSILIDHSNSFMNVDCGGAAVLDSADLPSAITLLRVTAITLSKCPPPENRSLADVFEVLNVQLLSSLGVDGKPNGRLVFDRLPQTPPLTDRHFYGLEDLLVLRMYAADKHVEPERGFLRPLTNLRVLNMQKVILPLGELDKPPPELYSLNLNHAGVEQLPIALLSSTKLRSLTVVSKNRLDKFTVPPKLTNLDLRALAVNLTLDAAPELPYLTLTNWVETNPPTLSRCENLKMLHLINPAVEVLPDFWLSNCSRLETLVIQYAMNLTSLPPKMLKNVTTLTQLSFKNCALKTLPVELLDSAPRLRELYLMGNQLLTLPSGLFTLSREVQVLNLSSNNLDSKVFFVLEPLHELTELNLGNNQRITDQHCETYGKSPIQKSTKLTKLILSGTGVYRICYDWRTDMKNLTILDLRNTKIEELWFDHLLFQYKARVLLNGAPLTVVGMDRKQYNEAIDRISINQAFIQLDKQLKLECDCRMYWARRVLDIQNSPMKYISNIKCVGGKTVKDMKAEDFVCPDSETSEVLECAAAELPALCACAWHPGENSRNDTRIVRAVCEGRALSQVPVPAYNKYTLNRSYELLLKNNNIGELRAEDLQDNIKRIDLRNNTLQKMDGETVTRLYSFNGRLQLANNSLDCSCNNAKMVGVFKSRPNITDLQMITCDDGSMLIDAVSEDCMTLTSWLACVLAVLFALAIVVLIFLSSRERRFFLKAVLHRWGCLWYDAEPEEDKNRLYDAFVTFSHKDEPVVLELMRRLEPPYKLCVHQRDWVPGRYITEQITESVTNSRRTIALVSRHYQESGWALAEFKQAHTAAMREAKPRLVVILLEDPSTLQLDEQLQGYLKTNTYVRWGDSWFWDKLMAALPRPRPPDSTATPSAAKGHSPPVSVATPAAATERSPPPKSAPAVPRTPVVTPAKVSVSFTSATQLANVSSPSPAAAETAVDTDPVQPAQVKDTVKPTPLIPAELSIFSDHAPKRRPMDTKVIISPNTFEDEKLELRKIPSMTLDVTSLALLPSNMAELEIAPMLQSQTRTRQGTRRSFHRNTNTTMHQSPTPASRFPTQNALIMAT